MNNTLTHRERADKIIGDFQQIGADWGRLRIWMVEAFQTVAKEAAAAEREACAKLAESKCAEWNSEGDGESVNASQAYYGMADAGHQIAAMLRARSTP